jgi:NADH-quinone oxidoreductase subunit C
MADEQKPEAPAPPPAGGTAEPAKPSAEAPKAAAPKPAVGAHAPPKPPAPMASTPWEGELPALLKERFAGDIVECASYLGQNFVVIKSGAAVPVIEYLKLEADFDYLVDITAVDYPNRAERFDLIYVLYSFTRNERVRLKALFADGAQPQTVVNILMPEEWEGFPLRKENSIIKQDDRWVKDNLGIESGQ